MKNSPACLSLSLSTVLSAWHQGLLPPVSSAKAFGWKNRQSRVTTGLFFWLLSLGYLGAELGRQKRNLTRSHMALT